MTTFTKCELLVILAEESAEVIQATTKCLRFGFSHFEPGYGLNSDTLSKELGDLLGIADELELNWEMVEAFRRTKIERAERAKAERS